MSHFHDLIESLNEMLGLEMVLDKKGVVKLVLDGTITLQIEFHSFKEAYCLVSPVEQLYQGLRRESVLKAALKANHTFRPKSGHFGFVEKKGVLLLFCYIPLAIATPDEMFQQMVRFSKQVHAWKEALATGLDAPQNAFEEPNLPKHSLFHNFTKP